ncbi:EcsC family protein [Flavihumibacter petaseus]|uniref:EcsC family protein n=1 Tax=Flavihumibacter petaseus NBRC 106054 TaxID=1220578 RepID=A0A0E9N757_9BACT|nr:EcsC family protein [Flavihumibacter petaseus]GAO45531.1 hypothetical protein FPE01S_06_00220 [Flavihumibacter petaseus NBRC 106054]
MSLYEQRARIALQRWQYRMQREPGFFSVLSKRLQRKVNALIPEKVHQVITTTLRELVKAVLFGSRFTTGNPMQTPSLMVREAAVREKIRFYRNTAALEGGLTGAGGFVAGLADFPLLLSIKIKLLFEIATLYGFDVNDYRERVYILHIFELAFSSPQHRKKVYRHLVDWEEKSKTLPEDIKAFDWRNFQQEYRDYLDIAKMAQLIPVIGAPVGLVVNYQLLRKLGETAMNAYRMRLI